MTEQRLCFYGSNPLTHSETCLFYLLFPQVIITSHCLQQCRILQWHLWNHNDNSEKKRNIRKHFLITHFRKWNMPSCSVVWHVVWHAGGLMLFCHMKHQNLKCKYHKQGHRNSPWIKYKDRNKNMTVRIMLLFTGLISGVLTAEGR